MPFKEQVFMDNVEARVAGPARDELRRLCQAYAALTTSLQKARAIGGLMEVLERDVALETRRAIMEACGRRCIGASTLERAQRLQRDARDLDDLLARLNEAHIGGGHLRREGDAIHAAYERCYCGSVSKAREPVSATYCRCSCGWYRQLFETLLDRPVEVELLGSILQGEESCRFFIHI